MHIGILEAGEVADHLRAVHGDYPAMFARLLAAVEPGLDFATIRVTRGELPTSPRQADAWIVTGSRHGVYDKLPWIEPLKDFLRACIAEKVPVIGVCFGHQILAEALGGRVEKSAKGWGAGVHDYAVTARAGWMAALPDRFAVGAMHQDQVVAKPEGAVVLATSDFCPYAALAYGDPEAPAAISVQPHPEFEAGFLDALIALRSGSVIPEEVAGPARASLARPVEAAAWARLFIDYLRAAAAARAPIARSA